MKSSADFRASVSCDVSAVAHDVVETGRLKEHVGVRAARDELAVSVRVADEVARGRVRGQRVRTARGSARWRRHRRAPRARRRPVRRWRPHVPSLSVIPPTFGRDELQLGAFLFDGPLQRAQRLGVATVADQHADAPTGERVRTVLDDAQCRRRLRDRYGSGAPARSLRADRCRARRRLAWRGRRRRCAAGRRRARGCRGVSTFDNSNVSASTMCRCSTGVWLA